MIQVINKGPFHGITFHAFKFNIVHLFRIMFQIIQSTLFHFNK
ncbi:protein of unknown function [Vibrio tapetis subsp. tapetis]|uniref:Uncharacterized protein n=1 Tax=Vibrio tapetis subsp. tapetis TaxID=1671868 RepID=A0A2N8ZIF6_9VIBR|nr:protein of unknown function [Vibrio tapetis subsp. tapetis]